MTERLRLGCLNEVTWFSFLKYFLSLSVCNLEYQTLSVETVSREKWWRSSTQAHTELVPYLKKPGKIIIIKFDIVINY